MIRPAALLIALALVTPVGGDDQHYAEIKGWHFDNWRTDPLSWELFRDTFLGIPPTRDPVAAGFDVLFYDNLYRSELASSGNCYGMAIQSLLMVKNGGHLGFCAPVPQYFGDLVGAGPEGAKIGPTDPRLARVINQMHGHQVNMETLRFFLDRIASGKTRDGNYAYDQLLYYKLREDPTVVSITESTLPADGAHTMVAYDARVESGQKRIFVYDPNRPWPTDSAYYTGEDNVITIDSGGGWSFVMVGPDGPEIWSGTATTGGNILISPLSVAAPLGRVPTSLGIDAATAVLTLFVFAGGGEVEQVTDDSGRRLYQPGTRLPETDPAARLGNVFPWFPSDQDAGGRRLPFSTYFVLGEVDGGLHLELSHTGDEYALRMIGPRGSVELLAQGGTERDSLTLANVGGATPRVILEDRAPRTYDVLLTRESQPGERVRQFRVQGLKLGGYESSVQLAVTEEGDALEVTAPAEADLAFDLEVRRQTLYDVVTLQGGNISVEKGEVRRVQPDSWIELEAARLETRSSKRPSPPDKRRRGLRRR